MQHSSFIYGHTIQLYSNYDVGIRTVGNIQCHSDSVRVSEQGDVQVFQIKKIYLSKSKYISCTNI